MSETDGGAEASTQRGTTARTPPSAEGAGLRVRKTYKLFVGGAFPRSESGRSYPVRGMGGALLANAAQASRKDARDAVVAARAALARWKGTTAYNRGQVLYRVAEMLDARRGELADAVAAGEGVGRRAARHAVEGSVDLVIWYAGLADKVAQVLGSSNPVAGPYFDFSVPEPCGVVALVAPQASSLLGLVGVLAPVVVTGNAAVVVASEERPLPAIAFSEVIATADVPAGVVNVLSGRTAELAPVLAGHMDVDGIDLSGVEPSARGELERVAAGNVKRVFAANHHDGPPSLRRLRAFVEIKTVWHPVGM